MTDEGVSAFRGRNAIGGALGRFLARAEAGEWDEGSVLVVERLDRYSRAEPLEAMYLLTRLTRCGIDVYTTRDRQLYTRDNLRGTTDIGPLLQSLLHFVVAHQESAKKSDVSRVNWSRKKAEVRASGGVVTSRGPMWLRYDEGGNRWEVVTERADVVRRVFEMAAQGKGTVTIARELNAQGVQPFGQARKDSAPQWHQAVISRLLRNPAVIGTYTPTQVEYTRAGKKRRNTQADQAIPSYFPAVVDPDLYATVTAMRMDSAPSMRGRHATNEVQNLFGGLLRCAECGAGVHRDSKGVRKEGRPPIIYLHCMRAKTHAGCDAPRARYAWVEDLFLHNIGANLSEMVPGDASGELEYALQRLVATDDAIQDAMFELREMMQRDRSSALRRELTELAQQRDALEEERRALVDRIEATSGRLVTKRLGELAEVLEARPVDRPRANALLRQLARRIVFDTRAGTMRLEWKAGGYNDFRVTASAFGFVDETKKTVE